MSKEIVLEEKHLQELASQISILWRFIQNCEKANVSIRLAKSSAVDQLDHLVVEVKNSDVTLAFHIPLSGEYSEENLRDIVIAYTKTCLRRIYGNVTVIGYNIHADDKVDFDADWKGRGG